MTIQSGRLCWRTSLRSDVWRCSVNVPAFASAQATFTVTNTTTRAGVATAGDHRFECQPGPAGFEKPDRVCHPRDGRADDRAHYGATHRECSSQYRRLHPAVGGVRRAAHRGGRHAVVGGDSDTPECERLPDPGPGAQSCRGGLSGFVGMGVTVVGTSSNNRIQGNFVGTNAAGTAALANSFHGLQIQGGTGNFIGTDGDGVDDALEGNLISGNTIVGVFLIDAVGNRVSGNRIGTNAAATAALPNGSRGVLLGGSSNNIIGSDGNGTSDVRGAERHFGRAQQRRANHWEVVVQRDGVHEQHDHGQLHWY